MIQGAIFDADGTLLDSMFFWDELGDRLLLMRGIQPEKDLARILYPMTLEESSEYLIERYHLPETADDVRQGQVDILRNFYLTEVQLKPGAARFLARLHEMEIPMVIATAGDETLLTATLDRLGVRQYFREILSCTALCTDKQHPLIYEAAARSMSTPPEKTCVFEDVIYGLQSAREAGCIPVAIEDQSSLAYRDEILRTARYSMKDFSDIDAFLAFAQDI